MILGERLRACSLREREVLKLIASGFSTKEIAAKLGLSERTVDKHRQGAYDKLDVHDAVRATHLALRAGLIDLDVLLETKS